MGPNVLTNVQYLPLCAGLTVIGLIATYFAYRRQGLHAAARVLAWALLPLGLGLAGAAKAIWQVISALASFAFHLAFSPTHWVGAALLALSIVLFVATGAVSSSRLRRLRSGGGPGQEAAVEPTGNRQPATSQAALPAVATADGSRAARRAQKAASPGAGGKPAAAPVDPDMAEIEAILKQRGIG